jgi:L-arabinose transport system ATP-binding protein
VTRDQIMAEMVGREISNIWGFRARERGEVRLEVKDLAGREARTPSFLRRG